METTTTTTTETERMDAAKKAADAKRNTMWFRHGKQKTLHAHLKHFNGERTLCLGVNENLPFALVGADTENRCRHCERELARRAYEPSDICVAAGKILSRAYRGLHHCPVISDHGWYASINVHGHLATFDSQVLTELVIGAHEECVRLEITPAGPYDLKLLFHQRQGREGDYDKRHPTMEAALADYRKHSPDGWRDADKTPKQYVWNHATPAKSRRG